MTSSSRGSIEANEPSALQDAIEDGGRQILVVQHLSPFTQGLVGSEDHGPLTQVPVVHDMKKDVGGVLPIGQVADLVDDQHVRVRVGGQRLLELSLGAGVGETLDQFCSRGAERLEAVLDSPIADGHRQVGLAAAGLAVQDERTSFADKVGPKIGAEERLAKGRLEREIELVNGLEERKVGAPSQALQTRLLPSGHLLGEQESQEVTVRPAFLLGLSRDLFVDAARVRQVEALEQSIQFRLGESPALGDVLVRRDTHQLTSREEDFSTSVRANPKTSSRISRCPTLDYRGGKDYGYSLWK